MSLKVEFKQIDGIYHDAILNGKKIDSCIIDPKSGVDQRATVIATFVKRLLHDNKDITYILETLAMTI